MRIILYQNTSPANMVNKSPTQVGVLEGVLRAPTSIINPVISIEYANPVGFNYIYIQEFGRYYFVNGISIESDKLIVVSAHVDVLKTYATAIANFDAVVKRNENKFNLYLDDGIFKAYQNTKHKVIQFPYGFTEYSYILALAGNGDS